MAKEMVEETAVSDDESRGPLPPGVPYEYDKVFEICREFNKAGLYLVEPAVLLMPRNDYQLSFDLHNDGMKEIVSLVPDVETRRELIRRTLELESAKEGKLVWRGQTSVKDKYHYSIIVDETFATMSDTLRKEFHTKVNSLIVPKGCLCCYLPKESIASFFNIFVLGWKIEVKTLRPECKIDADVLLMATRLIPELAFPVLCSADDYLSDELGNVINEENKRRKTIRGWISSNIPSLEVWADFEDEIQGVKEDTMSKDFRLEFEMIDDDTSEKFLISLHDLKEPDTEYGVVVFYIPHAIMQQDTMILKRENYKFLPSSISPSFPICRLLVVCPEENVKDKSSLDIEFLLRYVLRTLTPQRFQKTSNKTLIEVLTKSQLKKAEIAMKKPLSIPTPVSPVASSPTLQNSEERFPAPTLRNDGESETFVEETVQISTLQNDEAATSGYQSPQTSFLKPFDNCGKQEYNLNMWLDDTKERWSKLYAKWNTPDSRMRNYTSSIRNWDARRPTRECTEVIHGIVAALCDMKIKGIVHGNLDNIDNYRLLFDKVVNNGVPKRIVIVKFVNHVEEDKSDSMGKTDDSDIMQVMDVIFKKILGGDNLPRLWKSLYDKMNELGTQFRTMSKKQISSKLVIIEDHFCFWEWTEVVALYNRLWSTYFFIRNAETLDGKITPETKADQFYYDQVNHAIRSLDNKYKLKKVRWYDAIPKNSPWENFSRAQGYGTSAQQQLRFIRALRLHYSEKTGSDEHLKYFEDGGETESTHDRYVELLVCECFFEFLEHCFMAMHEYVEQHYR